MHYFKKFRLYLSVHGEYNILVHNWSPYLCIFTVTVHIGHASQYCISFMFFPWIFIPNHITSLEVHHCSTSTFRLFFSLKQKFELWQKWDNPLLFVYSLQDFILTKAWSYSSYGNNFVLVLAPFQSITYLHSTCKMVGTVTS